MNIEGFGNFSHDEDTDWWISDEISVPCFQNKLCQFVLEGYVEDDNKEDYQNAMLNMLRNDASVLKDAEAALFAYYKDIISYWDPREDDYIYIKEPTGVWEHIRFGSRLYLSRHLEDRKIYIITENGCSWEIEHGLMMVFEDGKRINKVGGFDGHPTNSESDFKDLIYIGHKELFPEDYERRSFLNAARDGEGELVLSLLKQNASLKNAKDIEGNTAVHFAAALPDTRLLKDLIAAGCRLDGRTEKGEIPLHFARTPTAIRLLLESDIDINTVDSYNRTALIAQAQRPDGVDCVATLLEFGADPRIKNNARQTAYQVARTLSQNEIAELLASHKPAIPWWKFW